MNNKLDGCENAHLDKESLIGIDRALYFNRTRRGSFTCETVYFSLKNLQKIKKTLALPEKML